MAVTIVVVSPSYHVGNNAYYFRPRIVTMGLFQYEDPFKVTPTYELSTEIDCY
jgi:hypothetical protein